MQAPRAFLSTPSARRATCEQASAMQAPRAFLSTPSARRATDPNLVLMAYNLGISIHALREEGDDAATLTLKAQIAFLSTPSARRATFPCCFSFLCIQNFYPRPPRGGRRRHHHTEGADRKFLSTPSARRATHGPPQDAAGRVDFYPRPPRGGRRHHHTEGADRKNISIHALREEGDNPPQGGEKIALKFLSTPSARRATCQQPENLGRASNFYPRPPRGGRPTRAG